MYDTLKPKLEKELKEIEDAGLFKKERIITSPQAAEITISGGQKVLNFCANNYLGLSSHPKVIEAAKNAQAHEFIEGFAEGYDTVIGERGVTLSGGQRQRLALARAFLTNPHILILDDSTSAIDSETEDKIQRAIYAAAKGRTTFIITHRLSQIRWADQILVLRGGKLVAAGNHEDLMNTSEAYRRIFSDL